MPAEPGSLLETDQGDVSFGRIGHCHRRTFHSANRRKLFRLSHRRAIRHKRDIIAAGIGSADLQAGTTGQVFRHFPELRWMLP